VNKMVIVAAAAGAAYLFRTQLEAALGISTAAAPAPLALNPTAAPPGVTTPIAPPAAAAAPAAPAALPALPPPVTPSTINADSPQWHAQLVAMASAPDGGTLAATQARFGLSDSSYVLNVNLWNWYLQTALNETPASAALIAAGSPAPVSPGLIQTLTSAGQNAITASQYLALRQSMGLA
jgi:hypothetical protein